VFFEHRFVRKGRVIGVVAGRAVLKAQSGPINPQVVSPELGHSAPSPELPEWVRCFDQSAELLSELVRDEERSKGYRPDMSALGHKQTYAVQKGTSALPPIATAKADSHKSSCLLYPRKRTCAVQLGMSALGQ
jgi:hypothetical protein